MTIYVRKSGAIGHLTLNRPETLNSLTYDMLLKIENALNSWEFDQEVALVVIDSIGDKAFCAGGDIQDLYRTGINKDYSYGKAFWNDEYRLNAKIKNFSKPFVSFIKGFAMGGGVGVSCHGSHRVVGESSKIAMPECGIGLIPDVGASFLLSKNNRAIGTFLGISGYRMEPSDAIFSEFADFFIPENLWPEILNNLIDTGDVKILENASQEIAKSNLEINLSEIMDTFNNVKHQDLSTKFSSSQRFGYLEYEIEKYSPLSVATEIKMMQLPKINERIENALEIEYRFTSRSMEHGDFLEGIRAMVIDKDKKPNWKHKSLEAVSNEEVDFMLCEL